MTSPSRPLSLQSVPIAAGRHSQASAAYHLSSSHLSSSYPASYPMAATLEGHHQQHHSSSMMKLYGTNQDSWNTSTVYATTGHLQGQKVNAFGQTVQQQQQPQPQQTSQQLEQINFLVRKECCSEIDQAISELGISLDPYNWNISDVQKWLLWMQQWLQLPTVKLEHFHLDGYSLCQLSEDAFRQRTPGGEQLYAKLEIWRMAINYFRPEAILDTLFGDGAEEQQQQSNQAFPIGSMQNQNQMYTCASPYASSSSESSLYGSPISPEGYGLSSCNSSLPTYAESVYGTSSSCGGVHSPASPASSSHSSSTTTNCPSPYGQSQYTAAAAYGQMAGYNSKTMTSNNNNGVYGQTMDQMMTLGTVPPTSDYGSDAIPSDDDDMSDDEKCFLDYQHRLSMQQQQQQQPNGQPIQRSLPVQIKLEPDYPDSSVSPVYQQHQAHMLPPGHYRAPQSQYQMPVSQISVKSEMLGTSSTTPIAVAPAAATAAPPTVLPPPPRTSSSSHIHLWQFLKELLSQPHQFGSCIRWLDRSKGVFKIEDSVRVAKLWGARKNRPAMNYDKLSRSIRQYYKKGIMKKTERSQRLVYQFCTPYSL